MITTQHEGRGLAIDHRVLPARCPRHAREGARVIPAKAGIQSIQDWQPWIPALAGMTRFAPSRE